MKIEIDTYTIKHLGNDLLKQIEDLEANITRLKQIVEKTSEVWEGKDAEAFRIAMEETNLVELERLSENLKGYGEYLRDVPEVYKSLDEYFKNKSIE